MTEEVRACLLCGSDRSVLFDQRVFRGRSVTNRLCLDCGLVYQSPRMSEAELTAFYAEEYRRLQEGSADPTVRNITVQRQRAASLEAFLRTQVTAVSRHLDIGCSLGILLRHFQDAYATQAVGIEPGEAHRRQAQQAGLTVYASLEELERAGEPPFDLITMSHVLEHLAAPVEYLTHLRESRLAPDGWLLVEVPNLYAHDSFEVAHLTAFSPHTLREVLRLGGFEIVKFEAHGRPTSALFPLYLTVLCRAASQPDTRPIRPERGVTRKRRWGMLWRRILSRLLPGHAWLVQG
jgi:2-polyprenyl-3-methyl-5-hydroxy-6-metoxy-1,4-benzoquinol methylase